YFSLSHKRREDRLDPNIWDSCSQATLDLPVSEPRSGFVRQADLCMNGIRNPGPRVWRYWQAQDGAIPALWLLAPVCRNRPGVRLSIRARRGGVRETTACAITVGRGGSELVPPDTRRSRRHVGLPGWRTAR